VAGSWITVYWRRRPDDNPDWSGVTLTCPGVPPLVRSPAPPSQIIIVEALLRTGASESTPRQGAESCGSTPCHGTGGGSSSNVNEDQGRMRALAWPARPIRPYAKDLHSTALSAKDKQIPAGGGGLGPSPQIIDQPIEGAVNSRQDDMRQGSAQRRGA